MPTLEKQAIAYLRKEQFEDTIKVLDESIDLWKTRYLEKDIEEVKAIKCPLCIHYICGGAGGDCYNCPIYKYTYQALCSNTCYEQTRYFTGQEEDRPFDTEMINLLYSLRLNIITDYYKIRTCNESRK